MLCPLSHSAVVKSEGEDELPLRSTRGEKADSSSSLSSLREFPVMMSTKFSVFLTPSPISAFGFDSYYKILVTSLTSSAFTWPPLPPPIRPSYLEAPWRKIRAGTYSVTVCTYKVSVSQGCAISKYRFGRAWIGSGFLLGIWVREPYYGDLWILKYLKYTFFRIGDTQTSIWFWIAEPYFLYRAQPWCELWTRFVKRLLNNNKSKFWRNKTEPNITGTVWHQNASVRIEFLETYGSMGGRWHPTGGRLF